MDPRQRPGRALPGVCAELTPTPRQTPPDMADRPQSHRGGRLSGEGVFHSASRSTSLSHSFWQTVGKLTDARLGEGAFDRFGLDPTLRSDGPPAASSRGAELGTCSRYAASTSPRVHATGTSRTTASSSGRWVTEKTCRSRRPSQRSLDRRRVLPGTSGRHWFAAMEAAAVIDLRFKGGPEDVLEAAFASRQTTITPRLTRRSPSRSARGVRGGQRYYRSCSTNPARSGPAARSDSRSVARAFAFATTGPYP